MQGQMEGQQPNGNDMAQSMESLSIKPTRRRGKHAYHVLDNAALAAQIKPSLPSAEEINNFYSPGVTSPGPRVPTGNTRNFSPYGFNQDQGSRMPSNGGTGNGGGLRSNAPDQSTRIASRSTNAPPVDSMSAIPYMNEDRELAQDTLGPDPVFLTFEMSIPPPACCQYAIEDQGLSGPNFARLTMYNVPANESLRLATKLPLGLLVTPFAGALSGSVKNDPVAVPLADFSTPDLEAPRCRRCRSYINPSMQFAQGGSRFVCNMCQFSNPVDSNYYQPTDAYYRRVDWQERPELKFGTYDIAVPKEYWHEGRKPSALHQLFIIEVTADAMRKNLPKLTAEAIRETLYGSGNFPKGAKVGIVTFDSTLHFYNLSKHLEEPQMMVVSDIYDTFVPLEKGLFVDPEESRTVIEQLLDQIDLAQEHSRIQDSCFGAAVDVAYKALEYTGGRVSLVMSSSPSLGPGDLSTTKENRKSDSGLEQFKSSSAFYQDLSKKYAKAGISMNLYTFPNGYIDLANCAEVPRRSGGHTKHYPNYDPQRDGGRFIAEFVQTNTGETGHQCIIRVRCSNGLQVTDYYGNLFKEDTESASDPFIGCLDSMGTIGVIFKHDGKLDTKLDAHFQAALLYTSSDGQRRVRVINILASVSEQFKPVMNYVDEDACIGILMREALASYGTKTLKEIRVGISDRLVDVFAAYRQNAGSNLPPSQLLMPVALRGFIIYSLALLKSRPLRDGQTLVDGRVNAARLMTSQSATSLSYYLYPIIIGLHNLRPDDCMYLRSEVNELSSFRMPINVRASQKSIEDGGVYLMYDGQQLWLFIQASVNPNLLRDLFGPDVEDLAQLNSYLNQLPEVDTEVSKSARTLVDYFRQLSGISFLSIQLARQGFDGAEYEFYSRLVEDRIAETYAYTDYVSYVHRSVKQVIENGKSKATTNSLLNDAIKLSHGGI